MLFQCLFSREKYKKGIKNTLIIKNKEKMYYLCSGLKQCVFKLFNLNVKKNECRSYWNMGRPGLECFE